MPLITEADVPTTSAPISQAPFGRKASGQFSNLARNAMNSGAVVSDAVQKVSEQRRTSLEAPTSAPRSVPSSHPEGHVQHPDTLKPAPNYAGYKLAKNGVGQALSDTPMTSAPGSPKSQGKQGVSGSSTPRIRPTTLDIPGLTKSKVSPDGRIAQRDIGAKLVIVMVGLPARGKSYITKKICRYLNWSQHDARIFNVGERRRVAAGTAKAHDRSSQGSSKSHSDPEGALDGSQKKLDTPEVAARILINGQEPQNTSENWNLPEPLQPLPKTPPNGHEPNNEQGSPGALDLNDSAKQLPEPEPMQQDASFFDPKNRKAALIREQVALETLDELLDYILNQGGSVGILDATNSTLERRKTIMKHIRERAGKEVNVLFVESVCEDKALLESNMRLKLSGPDYRDKDPIVALEDFKQRVAIYEKNYLPIGKYEQKHDMPYVKMIDVGRIVVTHRLKGFIALQTAYYLMNFNLAPRQIWITRHGESMDNVHGKIGGDSDLSDNGRQYAKALSRFIDFERKKWEVKQKDKAASTHFPPLPGDHSPPNPHYNAQSQDDDEEEVSNNFCVWTSMLKRSIQSAEFFNEDDYEVKQLRPLDELNAGDMEGMTYEEIRKDHAEEYACRRRDKMHYRYPGAGGEGYLDVINRLKQIIIELERMTEHCLLITHRSVARVLLGYFLGLPRDDVANLDVPLGMLYSLEPKPYGVQFMAYRYNPETDWFDSLPDFKLQRAPVDES